MKKKMISICNFSWICLIRIMCVYVFVYLSVCIWFTLPWTLSNGWNLHWNVNIYFFLVHRTFRFSKKLKRENISEHFFFKCRCYTFSRFIFLIFHFFLKFDVYFFCYEIFLRRSTDVYFFMAETTLIFSFIFSQFNFESKTVLLLLSFFLFFFFYMKFMLEKNWT